MNKLIKDIVIDIQEMVTELQEIRNREHNLIMRLEITRTRLTDLYYALEREDDDLK